MTPGLIVSAPASGTGKTTVMLGLLRCLAEDGVAVQPYKCGPDYIDPAFHRAACGRESFNLDSWAMPRGLLATQLARGGDVALAEGSMGLFDGVAFPGEVGTGASADIAALTGWPVVVVLDPGHGGIDPGAEREGQTEAKLMLTFARELKEALLRDGRFKVVMTRNEDVFVPLETRISIARAAGATVFLSLHADALAEGEAQGATVYTLAEEATDEAAQALAERHDRDDLLAGLDLSAQDDVVVTVLMDMARTETQPRVDRLAGHLVGAIKGAELRMHRHPHQQGGFSVLKSPDIPSALVELGFLSSARDLKRLEDPEWRARMAAALVAGLAAWAEEDRAIRAVKGG